MRWIRVSLASAAMGVVAVVLLSGCVALPVVVAGGPLIPRASSTPLEQYSDGSTSVRGNIPKVTGVKAGLSDNGVRTVTFTVTRMVADPTCLNADAPPPGYQHYLEIDLHVVTTSELGYDGSGSTVTFDPQLWSFYPDGGRDGQGASLPTDDCQVSTPPLPERIGPAQVVDGSLILDVETASSYIAYRSECGCHTWEWPAPPLPPGATG